MARLVYGQGVYVKGDYLCSVKGIETKEYKLWTAMIERCYSSRCKEKHPSYLECSASENFKNFQYFAEWCQHQIGFGKEGWELDKDILVKGNKVYSENTCVFVPKHINTLVNKNPKAKGKLLAGVSYCGSKKLYKARGSLVKVSEVIGYYNTELEAHLAYKSAKRDYISQVAERWRSAIDQRVYTALVNWEV